MFKKEYTQSCIQYKAYGVKKQQTGTDLIHVTAHTRCACPCKAYREASMLRTILLVIIAVLYLILTLPVMGILALIGRKDPARRERIARPMVQWVFRLLTTASGSRVEVKGLENIPEGEPVLFIGNHRSIFDIITVYPLIRRPVSFVSKLSIHKIPLLGIWMDYINCLYFDRSDMKQAMRMILDGTELLKNGTSVFIYPEGTRKKKGTELPLGEFHEGSFRMAARSGRKIVPVAFTGTIHIFEEHKPWIHPSQVTITFCKPIDPTQFDRKEQKKLGAMTRDILTDALLREGVVPDPDAQKQIP